MTSKETIDLVTKQNQILQVNLEKHMDQVTGLQSTVISGRVDAKIDQKLGDMCGKMDQMIKADEKRNGKLSEHSDKIIELEKYDSNREAVRKALGKSIIIGCTILGAAGTLVGILHIVGK